MEEKQKGLGVNCNMYTAFFPAVILLFLHITLSTSDVAAQQRDGDWFQWSTLPSHPDPLGLGGAFSGESNGALIVAGGSNFEKPIWEGGKKAFHRAIYILEKSSVGEYMWHRAGDLPYAVSNGACVNTGKGILCMGGANGQGDLDKVIHLSWDPMRRKIEIDDRFPPLPEACSYLSTTILKDRVYVAGGKNAHSPDGMSNFWMLKLSNDKTRDLHWEKLPGWPGPERFGAVLAAQNNVEHPGIFLFSGKSGTNYLTDAYQFRAEEGPQRRGWTRKRDLPTAAMVASSISYGPQHIILFSGSDGHDTDKIMELKEKYEFSKQILAYNRATDTWTTVGNLPFGIVTSNVIWWDGMWVIPGGEIGPGRRTNKILAGRVE